MAAETINSADDAAGLAALISRAAEQTGDARRGPAPV
ncbi:MAG TPA: DUF1285 domain-containing protein, partial [Agrobacterium sp.]|nr:DUF1285 domain-containing protein [Agrobacterium sp.]